MFVGLIHRYAVIGHDRCGPCPQGGLKGNEVIVESAAWIDLALLELKVRIQPLVLRTATGKVLGHARDTVRAEALALKSLDIGLAERSGEVSILSEGAEDPGPARLGR